MNFYRRVTPLGERSSCASGCRARTSRTFRQKRPENFRGLTRSARLSRADFTFGFSVVSRCRPGSLHSLQIKWFIEVSEKCFLFFRYKHDF